MSKQSDGSDTKTNPMSSPKAEACILIIGDCEVDCSMRLFLPLSITYSDFTDWNWNCT